MKHSATELFDAQLISSLPASLVAAIHSTKMQSKQPDWLSSPNELLMTEICSLLAGTCPEACFLTPSDDEDGIATRHLTCSMTHYTLVLGIRSRATVYLLEPKPILVDKYHNRNWKKFDLSCPDTINHLAETIRNDSIARGSW